jgi:transcriptional regulator with XRE-family HTH domain
MSENIVKQTAKELGMTYKELAEAIGVSEGTLSNATSTGKVSKQLEKSLELLRENQSMKKDFEIINKFKEFLNK